MMMKVAVLGIGNVLIGDDAVGPTVVNLLEALWEFPEGVVVEDMGTPSLDLAARLSDFDAVIFVDAVSAKAEPGTIRLYTVDEILRHPPGLRLSQHDPSLKETLLTVQLLDTCPRHIILVGVVPQTIEQFGLSEVVEAAVPLAAEAVIEQLAKLGIASKRRTAPASGTPWWSAA
jgi:hydrogenase maturation protease